MSSEIHEFFSGSASVHLPAVVPTTFGNVTFAETTEGAEWFPPPRRMAGYPL
jgi:hypothetical protein